MTHFILLVLRLHITTREFPCAKLRSCRRKTLHRYCYRKTVYISRIIKKIGHVPPSIKRVKQLYHISSKQTAMKCSQTPRHPCPHLFSMSAKSFPLTTVWETDRIDRPYRRPSVWVNRMSCRPWNAFGLRCHRRPKRVLKEVTACVNLLLSYETYVIRFDSSILFTKIT